MKHMDRVEIRLYPDSHPNDVKLGWFVKERADGTFVCQIDGANARPLVNVSARQFRPLDAVTQLGDVVREG